MRVRKNYTKLLFGLGVGDSLLEADRRRGNTLPLTASRFTADVEEREMRRFNMLVLDADEMVTADDALALTRPGQISGKSDTRGQTNRSVCVVLVVNSVIVCVRWIIYYADSIVQ
jgi:hypothetical protein